MPSGSGRTSTENRQDEQRRIPHQEPAGGTGSLEAAIKEEPNPIRRFLKILGPGLITGASDSDPSGIGTYAVAGASLGYAPLWTALVTFPLMASIQFMCAKVGMVSGRGLAGVLRKDYPRPLLYTAVVALFAANTINVGADIGAIAAAINLLVPIPIVWMIVPVALVILGLQFFGSYRMIAGIFKWLTLALLAYVASSLFARPDWGDVLRATFVPTIRFDPTFLSTLVAILGTTITPYLFFWQSSQEVEEEVHMGRVHLWQRKGASDAELKYAAMDVNAGMVVGNVVMYFVLLSTAATLHASGHTDVNSAAEAAEALRPLAGDAATILWAVGLIGAGFLAVPILSGSAAYAVCEAFGWQFGLDERPHQAKEFYGVIAGATLVGLCINFIGINPIDALFFTAVINGFVAPPLLVMIMLVANNPKVMGKRTNGKGLNALGGIGTLAMTAAAIALVFTFGKS